MNQSSYEQFLYHNMHAYHPLLPKSARYSHGALTTLRAVVGAVAWLIGLSIAPIFPHLSLPFYGIAALLAGAPALIHALRDLIRGTIQTHLLMTLAAFASAYFEAYAEGTLLLVLFDLSHTIEEYVIQKAQVQLQHLYDLQPTYARIKKDAKWCMVPADTVAINQQILVKTGEIIPLDALVIEGVASVSLAHLTGESTPKTYQKGSAALSGGRLLEGALTLHVTHQKNDSTLTKILQLTEQAKSDKTAWQSWLELFIPRYAQAILIGSTTLCVILYFLLGVPFLGQYGALERALAWLITASPCALFIAEPVAHWSALSCFAKMGACVRGMQPITRLADVQHLLLDKTGTVTTGTMKVCKVWTLDPFGKSIPFPKKQQAILAKLEETVNHPIANALTQHYTPQKAPLEKIENTIGCGIRGSDADGEQAIVGSMRWVEKMVPLPACVVEKMTLWSECYKKVVLFTYRQHCTLIALEDSLRPGISNAISALHTMGVRTAMLTGDQQQYADSIANKIGIDTVEAELLPQQKQIIVERYRQQGTTAMVGDGLNDAPALAQSDIGIAVSGQGRNAAAVSADIVLLGDRVDLLPQLIAIAKKMQRIIFLNIVLALTVIIVMSSTALLGILPLWLAVILHEGSTVLVGLNSVRLLYARYVVR